MRTLVLGIGNLLLSDEGIGVRAIEALEAHYQIPRRSSCLTAAPPAWS